MNTIQLKICDLPGMVEPLVGLWQRSLGQKWPITSDGFLSTIMDAGYQEGDCLVAEQGGQIVGAVVSNIQEGDAGRRGSVMCLFVAPEQQRQGTGTALLHGAIQRLKQQGGRTVYLGGGRGGYFWGGVPTNLPRALEFFRIHGWKLREEDTAVDLTIDLQRYTTPAWVWERVQGANITVGLAVPEERELVLAFERRHFYTWSNTFAAAFNKGSPVIIAKTAAGEIVGSCLAYNPKAGYRCVWSELLGEDTGCFGEVGVASHMRGRGIGMAVSACATEVLKEAGAKAGYVRWLDLISWYGKLGYTYWRGYLAEERPIEEFEQ